jgi:hypothetical protein
MASLTAPDVGGWASTCIDLASSAALTLLAPL